MKRILWAALCGLVFLAPARAEERRKTLQQVAEELAKQVKAVLDKESQTAVRIGQFSGVGQALEDSPTGGAIGSALARELGKAADPQAVFEVNGTYLFLEIAGSNGLKHLRLKPQVINTRSGETAKAFLSEEFSIGGNADIARIIGVSTSLKIDGSYEERNRQIANPAEPFIHGPGKTLVSATPQSPYDVEILAGPTPATVRGRAAVLEKGKPFVNIQKGEIYQVRVVNRAKYEVAVSLALDGVDQFAFSEVRTAGGKPKYSCYILGPAGTPTSTITIPGWHRNLESVSSFLVTELGQGAASRFPTKTVGRVGTITVGFALAYVGVKSGAETGFGPDVTFKQQEVKRSIDAPHEFVTLRYQR